MEINKPLTEKDREILIDLSTKLNEFLEAPPLPFLFIYRVVLLNRDTGIEESLGYFYTEKSAINLLNKYMDSVKEVNTNIVYRYRFRNYYDEYISKELENDNLTASVYIEEIEVFD